MNLLAPLDQYCERLDAGLWAEPLNAASNLALFLVAWLLWRRGGSAADKGMACLVALVGVGSLSLHIYATVWARWLDLLFIELFIYAFLALYTRRVFGLGPAGLIAVLLVYALFEWALTRAFEPGAFNDSYAYFPALLALGLMSALAWRRNPQTARRLGFAAGIFLVAVILRSMDLKSCATWPWGTHFIWHMLNATVLYCSVRGLHRQGV